MKIAFLTQGFGKDVPEASNITLRMLIEELVKRKNEVVVFARREHGQPLVEKTDGYKIIRQEQPSNMFVSYLRYLNFSKMISKEVKESKKDFDVIHNFGASPLLGLRGLFAKRYSNNAKLIQTIKSATSFTISYLFTPILNGFDVITVPTNFLKRRLVTFGLNPYKIKLIESYIDTEKFRPRNKDAIRKKHGFGKEKLVLYYGHLSEKKGISYLLEASKELEDARILLVTRSIKEFVDPYKKTIKDENLTNVKIIENTKGVEEYVNVADVVVLPYPNLKSTEAQPSCILETMASKIPLITTDLKELKELVSDKEVTFAKPMNAHDLANKIKHALSSPNHAMIERAYRKAKEFDKNKIIKKFVKLY